MKEDNNLEKLMLLLSRVLDIEIDTISDQTSPDNTENWDSYNGLMIVSELESTFNVHFTMDEVVSVKNVKDIKLALKKYGVDL